MEIIYRALANTLRVKDFSKKEECEKYERSYLPRMWSIYGTPTTDPANGYFVEVGDSMNVFWLRKLCPNESWKDLGATGLGIYRWDVVLERYEKISFCDYNIIRGFIESNRDNLSEWL